MVTAEFADFARELLAQRNAASLPLVTVQHPVGGIAREQTAARITRDVVAAVVASLQDEKSGSKS